MLVYFHYVGRVKLLQVECLLLSNLYDRQLLNLSH
jgi:hypothetical protein